MLLNNALDHLHLALLIPSNPLRSLAEHLEEFVMLLNNALDLLLLALLIHSNLHLLLAEPLQESVMLLNNALEMECLALQIALLHLPQSADLQLHLAIPQNHALDLLLLALLMLMEVLRLDALD